MKFLTSTEIVSSLKFPQIMSIKTENCNMPFDQKQDSNINLSISSLYHYLFNRLYIQLYYFVLQSASLHEIQVIKRDSS